MRNERFFVYIMSNRSRTIYVGVTNDLEGRVAAHRAGMGGAFTAKYRIHRLVYFEEYLSISDAIAREKEIKDMVRVKKTALIESMNPTWDDLASQIK